MTVFNPGKNFCLLFCETVLMTFFVIPLIYDILNFQYFFVCPHTNSILDNPWEKKSSVLISADRDGNWMDPHRLTHLPRESKSRSTFFFKTVWAQYGCSQISTPSDSSCHVLKILKCWHTIFDFDSFTYKLTVSLISLSCDKL